MDIDGAEGAGNIAEVDHLPPTLSLQYHFNPDGRFRPYIGAGLNYTTFSNEDTKGALAGSDLELDDSWGAAGQIGADVGLNDNWFLNLAVRYIDIDSDARAGRQRPRHHRDRSVHLPGPGRLPLRQAGPGGRCGARGCVVAAPPPPPPPAAG